MTANLDTAPAAALSAAMKGVGIVNVRAYVETLHGRHYWEDVLTLTASEDRPVLESAVGVGWYDVTLFARLLRAVDTVCGHGDLSLLGEIGEFEASQDFNRVLRVFLRVLTPMQIFKAEGRIWRQFQDAGSWHTVPAKGGNGMDATLCDWVVDEALCVELAGYLKRLVEFTGGRYVSVGHDECRARGAERCIFRYRWT